MARSVFRFTKVEIDSHYNMAWLWLDDRYEHQSPARGVPPASLQSYRDEPFVHLVEEQMSGSVSRHSRGELRPTKILVARFSPRFASLCTTPQCVVSSTRPQITSLSVSVYSSFDRKYQTHSRSKASTKQSRNCYTKQLYLSTAVR